MLSETRRGRGAANGAQRSRHHAGPFPRQTPVSCQFCRRRKLRCSRTQPCSNCKSRGLFCQLNDHQPETVPSAVDGTAPSGDIAPAASPSDSLPEMMERLRRLEKEVALHRERWDRLAAGSLPAAVICQLPEPDYTAESPLAVEKKELAGVLSRMIVVRAYVLKCVFSQSLRIWI